MQHLWLVGVRAGGQMTCHRRRECGGMTGGRILKKGRRPNVGRIGREAVLAVEPEELLLLGGQSLPVVQPLVFGAP